jgi:hypothetical protein
MDLINPNPRIFEVQNDEIQFDDYDEDKVDEIDNQEIFGMRKSSLLIKKKLTIRYPS